MREKLVFENRVLRKLFAAKRDEGTGDWRKVAPNIFRVIALNGELNLEEATDLS
jgi:hypothetical protein